jgi:hypothetical protein
MPAPKRLEAYPDWFMALAMELNIPEGWEGHIKEKTIHFSSPREAMAVRRQLYGFREAMFREGTHAMFQRFVTMTIELRGSDLNIMRANDRYPPPPEMSK